MIANLPKNMPPLQMGNLPTMDSIEPMGGLFSFQTS